MAGKSPRRRALRITLGYALFAAAWIVLTDLLVLGFTRIAVESSLKGLLFVAVTGILLQVFIERSLRDTPEADRLLAASRLAESEARLRAIVEQSISGIYVIQDGRFAYVNPHMAEIFGYASPDAVIGRNPDDFVAPEDRALVAQNIRRRLTGETKTLAYAFCGLRKDGSRFEVGVHGTVATYNGRPAIVGALQDISERVRAADERLARLTRVQARLETVGTLSMSKSLLAGDVLHFSREVTEAVARVTGVERANVWLFNEAETELRCIDNYEATPARHTEGAVLAEAQYANEFHALKSARYVDAHDPLTDPRTAGYIEGYLKPLGITSMLDAAIQISGKHLGLLCLEHVARPHRWEQDEIAFACQLADMTALAITLQERRCAQDAMRESEARFRAMIEQSISGTCIIGTDGRFVYVNPRLAAILGYDKELELVGKAALDVVVPENRALVSDNLRRRVAGEPQSARYSFNVLRRDGSRVTLGAHGTVGSYGGKRVVIATVQDVTELRRAEEEIQGYVRKLERAMRGTLEVVSKMVELRDPYTRGHERRVGEICAAIGGELGLPAERIEGLRVAGSVHDVGKIAVPAEILSKPTRLTPAEYELVKQHAHMGHDILQEVEFAWPVADVVWQHHERLDGSGYPRGLQGEQILLEARILGVADTVEAMSSHRPYRPSLGMDRALAEIELGRGRLYDARIADACLRLFREKGYTIPG